ncbi:hypothetical protein SSX86_020493 [Deinandra increscens subsp. villosa]|uniref:Receptor-like serine/threonine-protein kinase n=1 Tax=Deinandra increscens subsp. villosa TaxID=3103831 RepID=A0AAP0GTI0_9ASTR
MENKSTHIIFCMAFILLLSDCATIDTISANQEIKDGDSLVSEGGMFEMGFFSPGKSKNRYMGIWYKNISYGTIVWVANRETPITDKSGVLKLGRHGNLVILSSGNPMVWSSNLSNVSVSGGSNSNNPVGVVVKLLDSGNLVVWNNQNLIWQSFDYPGDTFLPGMKLGKDFVTGLQRSLTSWKSPDDPATGEFSYIIDTNGYPQTFGWHGEVIASRFGPWNGLGFSGFPLEIENHVYITEFVVNEKEIYHKYELISSVFTRVVLKSDGKGQSLQWIPRIKDWIVYADALVDTCDRFSLCGPYGMCSNNKHPPCTCMHGFEPRNQEEWRASDWVSGCIRKRRLKCGDGDVFTKMTRVKLPDTRRSWYNASMTLRECETICKRNCSCTGYANLDIRNGGSGCLLWFNELLDIRDYDVEQDIYIRIAASELEGHVDSQVPIQFQPSENNTYSGASNFIRSATYLCNDNRYMLDENSGSLHMEPFNDIPYFSLLEVARATCNFSASNKIGEGGFGPVYKGVLEDGREIAVKRLSETSEQGLDEFKNEVICIAKLQHRNLVKLLGYCIHQNELILIYEYMSNNSLDYFLFDETRSLMLDWPQRFNIIQGIARGILYLHQDSRLQIIHRDLKASNILLNSDMNPKISDFGLARNFVGQDTTAKTKKVVGTYGYISSEYAVHGRFSIKSDVFSYGVLVMEIISGNKNKEFSHGDHRDNLLGHAWRLHREGRAVELVSRSLHASCVSSEVLRSIHVALLCVQHLAEDRPTMLSVVLMLASEGALPQPKQPAFFTGESHSEVQSVSVVNEYMITQLYAR